MIAHLSAEQAARLQKLLKNAKPGEITWLPDNVQIDLDADYYVEGYLSSKDNARDVVLLNDIPLRLAVMACGTRALGKQPGIAITFENAADNTTVSISMTKSEALRLVEKLAECASWALRGEPD